MGDAAARLVVGGYFHQMLGVSRRPRALHHQDDREDAPQPWPDARQYSAPVSKNQKRPIAPVQEPQILREAPS